MLITCPECELQVSDKALTCPHCGYPLKAESAPRQTGKKQNRRRRLPNGFGQISEIKGQNLRKPFRAMVSVGKSSTGRPICKLLTPEAYFATYNEAYAALVEYNKHPYEIASDITLKELYEKWSEKYYTDDLSKTRIRSLRSAWDYCSAIYDVPAAQIRPSHIEYCMNNGTKEDKRTKKLLTPSLQTKDTIRSVLAMVLEYGIKNDIVDKNYARMVSLSKAERRQIKDSVIFHRSFSPEELAVLWENIAVPYVDMILINCYTGWRPNELCSILLDNVNIQKWTMMGGSKTKAGKDRTVPICSKIRDLVTAHYLEAQAMSAEYLFYKNARCWNDNTHVSYEVYAAEFKNIIERLHLDPAHRPHDCRKTFVTLGKAAGVNEYAIKRVVGHEISDLTERVYTERPFEWLAEEIEKIK